METSLEVLEHVPEVVEHVLEVLEHVLEVVEHVLEVLEHVLEVVEHVLEVLEHVLETLERVLKVLETSLEVLERVPGYGEQAGEGRAAAKKALFLLKKLALLQKRYILIFILQGIGMTEVKAYERN
ncbi:MAG: hypothetical protein LBG84_00855 [Treponema sp.]|nr:hypothetical protein [Treponema sp.]